MFPVGPPSRLCCGSLRRRSSLAWSSWWPPSSPLGSDAEAGSPRCELGRRSQLIAASDLRSNPRDQRSGRRASRAQVLFTMSSAHEPASSSGLAREPWGEERYPECLTAADRRRLSPNQSRSRADSTRPDHEKVVSVREEAPSWLQQGGRVVDIGDPVRLPRRANASAKPPTAVRPAPPDLVRLGDKMGQPQVNNVPPPAPISADEIPLSGAALRTDPTAREPGRSTFNPKVAGSNPARPT
jgi:hypothetical protein